MVSMSRITLLIGVTFCLGSCTTEEVQQPAPTSTTTVERRTTTTTTGQPVMPQSSTTTTTVVAPFSVGNLFRIYSQSILMVCRGRTHGALHTSRSSPSLRQWPRLDAKMLAMVSPGILGPGYFSEMAAVVKAAAGGISTPLFSLQSKPNFPALGVKGGKSFHEGFEPRPRLFVDHLSLAVEHPFGVRYHHPATEPGGCTKRPQDWKPGSLRERSTPLSRGCTDDSHRSAAEHVLDVFGRSGQPIDRILQDSRNRIVVLGSDDQRPSVAAILAFNSCTVVGMPSAASISPSYKGVPLMEAISTMDIPASVATRREQHGIERCARETAAQSYDAGHNSSSLIFQELFVSPIFKVQFGSSAGLRSFADCQIRTAFASLGMPCSSQNCSISSTSSRTY